MPSPFPGIDPFIEGQLWTDFHGSFVNRMRDAIVPAIRPKYTAVVEQRIYLTQEQPERHRQFQPELTIVSARAPSSSSAPSLPANSPLELPIAMPEEVRESFIEIRLAGSHEVVTVIELLSPASKRMNSEGQREYRSKRNVLLRTSTHLMEIDLLRGGERTHMAAPLPDAYGYVILSRAERRPMADVWPVQLSAPLPTVSVPLQSSDSDVSLDLQAIFENLYDVAGYDLILDYSRKPAPPLDRTDADLAARLLSKSSGILPASGTGD